MQFYRPGILLEKRIAFAMVGCCWAPTLNQQAVIVILLLHALCSISCTVREAVPSSCAPIGLHRLSNLILVMNCHYYFFESRPSHALSSTVPLHTNRLKAMSCLVPVCRVQVSVAHATAYIYNIHRYTSFLLPIQNVNAFMLFYLRMLVRMYGAPDSFPNTELRYGVTKLKTVDVGEWVSQIVAFTLSSDWPRSTAHLRGRTYIMDFLTC